MSRHARGDRGGMALALAVLALLVIGALVAGGFAAAHLEVRVGRNTLYAAQASGAAEAGAVSVVANWDSDHLGALAPGDGASLPAVPLPDLAAYEPSVVRLNQELFVVRSLGTRSDATGGVLARRVVSLVVRLADSAAPGSPTVRPLANRAWAELYE